MEFDYMRKQGAKFIYHVKVTLLKHAENGEYAYTASVRRAGEDLGTLARWPLNGSDEEAATREARFLIENDIERLIGINE